jgi:hypothetical protein
MFMIDRTFRKELQNGCRVCAVVAALLIGGCGGGGDGSPTAPGGVGSDTFATATVDGQPFTASILAALTGVNDGSAYLTLVALNGCGAGNTLISLNPYKLDSATLTEGTYSTSKSIQIPLGPGVSTTRRELTATIIQNNQNWIAPSTAGGGSGTLTITALSSSYVEGTFSFVAVPDFGNTSGVNRSVSGSFRAKIEDKRIC